MCLCMYRYVYYVFLHMCLPCNGQGTTFRIRFFFIVGSGDPAVIVRIIPKDGKMLFREMDRVGCVASVFPAEPPAGHSWIFDF